MAKAACDDQPCEHMACGLQMLIDLTHQMCDKCERNKVLNFSERSGRNGRRLLFRVGHLNKRGHWYAPCAARKVYQMILDRYPAWLDSIPDWEGP